MIDAHCHLESKEYVNDLDQVIELCKKEGLKALVSVCAHPKDFDRSLEIVDKYKNYVFLCASIHPEFIKEITSKQVDDYFDRLKENKDKLVGIGETGGDYFWIHEPAWQKKQQELFVRHIELAKELKKPLVIHCRDAFEDVFRILENQDVKQAMLHLFSGHKFIDRVIENDWWISVGPILLRSKNHKKIVKKIPLEKIMLETDSPWFGPDRERNTPITVVQVLSKIGELKELDIDYVEKITDKNSIEFFSLPI
ncbi:MAG: TatD family hydrolase [Candidatus Aenigmatarchaeota archaeon]